MRRRISTLVVATVALAAAGCGNKSPEGGTPGTDDSFKLAGPVQGSALPAATIKQGDSQSVKVTVERGKNFHKTVRLEAKGTEKVHATLDREAVKD